MNPDEALQDPFTVVAKALGCTPDSLTMESAMYRDHGWDSFGHLGVILALEKAYDVRLVDVDKYANMKAISQLYEERRQASGNDHE